MPTYEYRCTTCDQRFEIQQSFRDDTLTTCGQAVAAGVVQCPRASADGTLRKVFHAVGITFKGSGFYKTDSRAGANGAGGGSGSSGSENGSGGSSSESASSSSSAASSAA